MQQSLLVAALAVTLALPVHAAEPSSAAGSPMVSFTDGPTGFNFVWRPEAGWTFAGQASDAAATGVKAGLASSRDGFADGAPLAEFADASTGFRFVWRHGQGWQFAGATSGQVEGMPPSVQQLAAIAGDRR